MLGLVLLGSGCGPSIPLPPQAPVDPADYVAVSSSPRPPPVEFLPAQPRGDAVWVDGTWEWSGQRYGWRAGTWTVPPKGLRRARWVIVRRKEDGQLFFAPSVWKDAAGRKVDDSSWIHALGPQARARSRIGGPPAESDVPRERGREVERARPRQTPREESSPDETELR
ncbi:MAG: YXWGXW repeat-containing protein [Labilithrix sp.]|nr:YXWGXW repeat-containing protein [Labilithrix sp.]MCW5817741.1 YXWGXW repeat-containing protein [Labilithrix sp.]